MVAINFSVNPWGGEDHAPVRGGESSGFPQDGGVGNQKTMAGRLGFKPTNDVDDELRLTILKLMKYGKRIEAVKESILPKIKWRG